MSILATTMALLTSLSLAQGMPPQGAMGQVNNGGFNGRPGGQMQQNMSPAQFQERKAHILNGLKNHLACVERAQTQEQLHDCRPRREGPPRG